MSKRSRSRKVRRTSSKRRKTSRVSSRREIVSIAKKVAQQLDEKNRITLVKRNYLWADYEAESNRFGAGEYATWVGRVVELSNIRTYDSDFKTTVVQIDDPDTQMDESAPAGEISGVGFPTVGVQGRRFGQQVKIVGGDMHMRALFPEAELSGDNLCPKVKLIFGIYAWSSPNMDLSSQQIFPKPDAKALCRLPTFGYTKVLDRDENALRLNQKVRKLCEGTMIVQLDILQRREKRKFISFKLPEPLLLDYSALDQTGQACKTWKIFACVRSDTPVSTASIDYTEYQPIVGAVTRLFYVDA